MASLVPLTPPVKVAVKDGLELIATEAGRSESGLKACVQARNGSVKVDQLVAFSLGATRKGFAEAAIVDTDLTLEEVDAKLLELKDALESILRKPEEEDEDEAETHEEQFTNAARLVKIGRSAVLFHDQKASPFAQIPVSAHKEVWPLRSKAFKEWLCYRYYQTSDKPPGGQALEDALKTLEGLARFEGGEVPLSIRVASHEGNLYYDLCDSEWRVIRITPNGWEIIADAPLLFKRYSVLAPQIMPEKGGSLEMLRAFLNLKNENDWIQIVAWLAASLFPEIGHPILITHGSRGAAKTSTLRLLSSLVDPLRITVRCVPKDVNEWVQQASHAWCIMVDNVSKLPVWYSDALCRAVTGEGLSKRVLFSDDDDQIYEFRRIIGISGIEAAQQREDLLDRGILVGLESIPDDKRRSEGEIQAEWDKVKPYIFGALLDLVSNVLHVLPTVQAERLPRLADYGRIGLAVEHCLRWEPGTFTAAWKANREDQTAEALAASPIGEAVLNFLDAQNGEWNGSATELLQKLNDSAKSFPHGWPRQANGLSNQLKRLAPCFESEGIYVDFKTPHGRRQIALRRIRKEKDRSDRSDRSEEAPPSQNGTQSGTMRNDPAPVGTVSERSDEKRNGRNDDLPTSSNNPAARLLEQYADLFRAASDGKFPPREELKPDDGLPSIFNPMAAVIMAKQNLTALASNKELKETPRRIERDLSVIYAWWKEAQA